MTPVHEAPIRSRAEALRLARECQRTDYAAYIEQDTYAKRQAESVQHPTQQDAAEGEAG